MPEGVASIAHEEHIIDMLTLTTEPGVIGGIPASGLNFGAGINIQAIIDQPYQFDFYDGGGLDIAFLGLAETDQSGNVNVSKFGSRLAGAGGFINISQSAKKVVFVGSFNSGKSILNVLGGLLKIEQSEGHCKFVETVQHLSFSGQHAVAESKPVLYVAERCVFKLIADGLELIEITPGIELKRDVLSPTHRDRFTPDGRPHISNRSDGFARHHAESAARTSSALRSEKNTLFINFESYSVHNLNDVEGVRQHVVDALQGISEKVHAVINYDNLSILPDVIDPYVKIVQDLNQSYYQTVTRYSTSGFLRAKLGGKND